MPSRSGDYLNRAWELLAPYFEFHHGRNVGHECVKKKGRSINANMENPFINMFHHSGYVGAIRVLRGNAA